jgi:predicted PurR-regulated permease PerM
MGALTFYILGRERFFILTEKKGWKPGLAAMMFILIFLMLIAGPLYYAIILISPKVNSIFSHTDEMMIGLKAFSEKVKELTGQDFLNSKNITSLKSTVTNFIPTFLNSSAMILSNLLVMFFVLYFMLTGGRTMERVIREFIPLHHESVIALSHETKNMVKANAIGIPLISVIQGITAWIGVPLVVFLFAQGDSTHGTGLLIYSLVVTGNVDYLARVTLMKKIGDVHPLITVFGVIVGLQLFGFMGFIFGPLIFSYSIILVKIYAHEFVDPSRNTI